MRVRVRVCASPSLENEEAELVSMLEPLTHSGILHALNLHTRRLSLITTENLVLGNQTRLGGWL